MTVHASVFELFSGHHARTASIAPQISGAVVLSRQPFELGGAPRPGAWCPLPQPVIPFSGYDSSTGPVGAVPGTSGLGVRFGGTIIADVGSANYGVCDGSSAVWQRVGRDVTGERATLDSNGFIALDKHPDHASGAVGRNAPPLAINFGSTAFGNFGTFTADVLESNASGSYSYAYSPRNPYQGLAHFCEFEDDPPDGINDGSTIVRRLLDELSSPTTPYPLGIDSSNQTISVDGCNYAAVGPDCAVYIEAGDIGSAPEQIPAAVADNRASHFRFHPSVFIRRTPYIRSIARQYRDPSNVAAGSAGMPIRVSVRGPATSTRWLIIVDGAAQVVQLAHDPDIIRPRDIWNRVWVPLIYGSSAVSDAPILSTINDAMAPGPAISQIRLAYLEYARYLGPNGADTAQTGISA
jgi:hypothetical protein